MSKTTELLQRIRIQLDNQRPAPTTTPAEVLAIDTIYAVIQTELDKLRPPASYGSPRL